MPISYKPKPQFDIIHIDLSILQVLENHLLYLSLCTYILSN